MNRKLKKTIAFNTVGIGIILIGSKLPHPLAMLTVSAIGSSATLYGMSLTLSRLEDKQNLRQAQYWHEQAQYWLQKAQTLQEQNIEMQKQLIGHLEITQEHAIAQAKAKLN